MKIEEIRKHLLKIESTRLEFREKTHPVIDAFDDTYVYGKVMKQGVSITVSNYLADATARALRDWLCELYGLPGENDESN